MNKWKKISEKKVYSGYRKILRKSFKIPNNKIADYDTYQEKDTVCILALTKNKKVILAEQFRPGPEKTLMELPGGGIEKNETPLKAAKKELLEETGYTGSFKFVGTSYHCGYSNRIRYNFVAIDCKKIQKISNPDGEFTKSILMTIPEFKKHLRGGKLTDITTGYLGLDYLDLL